MLLVVLLALSAIGGSSGRRIPQREDYIRRGNRPNNLESSRSEDNFPLRIIQDEEDIREEPVVTNYRNRQQIPSRRATAGSSGRHIPQREDYIKRGNSPDILESSRSEENYPLRIIQDEEDNREEQVVTNYRNRQQIPSRRATAGSSRRRIPQREDYIRRGKSPDILESSKSEDSYPLRIIVPDEEDSQEAQVVTNYRNRHQIPAESVVEEEDVKSPTNVEYALEPADTSYDGEYYDEGVINAGGEEYVGQAEEHDNDGELGEERSHGYGKKYAEKEEESYHHGEHHAKGKKAGKGYKSKESHDKEHADKHGHEHLQGGKKEKVGSKKGHLEESNSYHKGHSHHKAEHAADKGHSKGHKKGKKTSGSRNVHHKDEYKKDEVFYDDEHDAGHVKEIKKEHGGHQEAKGGHSKKGHLHSGYKDAVKGVEGEKKEGHSYGHKKGHNASSGHKSHGGEHEGYKKAAGHKGREEHGYIHKSHGGGNY